MKTRYECGARCNALVRQHSQVIHTRDDSRKWRWRFLTRSSPPSPRASTPRRRDQRALTTRKKKISLLRETSRFLIKGSRSIQQVVLFSTNVLLVHFIRIHPVLRISLLSFFLPFFFHVYLSSFNLTCVNVIKILHVCIYIYIYIVSTILYENQVATSLNE